MTHVRRRCLITPMPPLGNGDGVGVAVNSLQQVLPHTGPGQQAAFGVPGLRQLSGGHGRLPQIM